MFGKEKKDTVRSRIEAYAQRATSLRFQITLSIITSIILTILVYNSFYRFRTFDPKPELYAYTAEQLNQKPVNVEAGLFINSFPSFDTVKNTFRMDSTVWFKFDPKQVSMETIHNFSFEKGTILKKSQPDITQLKNKVMAKYATQVQFTSDLDYRAFPFDDHRIFMVLTNKKMSPNTSILTSDKKHFQLEDNIYTGGLTLIGENVEQGFARSELIEGDASSTIETPRIVFSLDFKKPGIRRIILIIIPIILIFFLAIFSLSFDPSRQRRDIITLSVGSLTSLFTYRFVIETLSPSVGYFTLTDYIYTFVLACTFLVFLFSAFSIRTQELSYPIKLLRVSTILCLHIALIIFMYFLLY